MIHAEKIFGIYEHFLALPAVSRGPSSSHPPNSHVQQFWKQAIFLPKIISNGRFEKIHPSYTHHRQFADYSKDGQNLGLR